MNEYEIVNDLPIPNNRGRHSRYPLRELHVGQRILVEKTEPNIKSLYNAANKLKAKEPGWEFQGATTKDGKKFGLWCVARPDTKADEKKEPEAPKPTKPEQPKWAKPDPAKRVHEIPKHLLPQQPRRVTGSRY